MPRRAADAEDDNAGTVNEIHAVCPVADEKGEWTSLRLAVDWVGDEAAGIWDVPMSAFGKDLVTCLSAINVTLKDSYPHFAYLGIPAASFNFHTLNKVINANWRVFNGKWLGRPEVVRMMNDPSNTVYSVKDFFKVKVPIMDDEGFEVVCGKPAKFAAGWKDINAPPSKKASAKKAVKPAKAAPKAKAAKPVAKAAKAATPKAKAAAPAAGKKRGRPPGKAAKKAAAAAESEEDEDDAEAGSGDDSDTAPPPPKSAAKRAKGSAGASPGGASPGRKAAAATTPLKSPKGGAPASPGGKKAGSGGGSAAKSGGKGLKSPLPRGRASAGGASPASGGKRRAL